MKSIEIFKTLGYEIYLFCQSNKPRELLVTFDTMNTGYDVIDGKVFGLELASKAGYDLLAVRQKFATFYQDLSRSDFIRHTKMIFGDYDSVVFYGSSLGGYAALYYGGELSCRILAIAPRQPIHPQYGVKVSRKKFERVPMFVHDKIPGGDNHGVIVFDPYDAHDCQYVKNEILPVFPFIKEKLYPYAGHRLIKVLAETGELKNIVLNYVSRGVIKDFNWKLRANSSTYLYYLSLTIHLRHPKLACILLKLILHNSPTHIKALKLIAKCNELFGNEEQYRFYTEMLKKAVNNKMEMISDA